MVIEELFNKYIKDTKYKQSIEIFRIYICDFNNYHVYLNSKSFKHIYDRHIYEKENASDFFIILKNIENIIRFPDQIYLNKEGKRGNYILVKEIENRKIACVIEFTKDKEIEIVSIYSTGDKYLNKFVLLWS